MSLITPEIRGIIHSADRYAFRKEHQCLFPGCKRKAINGHAISRTSILEALAVEGVIYTQRYSFASMMRMTRLSEPVDVIEVGVNQASIFKGYCSHHDARLFAAADTVNPDKASHLAFSLLLRALSLEFCRKRISVDFNERFSELMKSKNPRYDVSQGIMALAKGRDFSQWTLDYFFSQFQAEVPEAISYYIAVVSHNVLVSCCGVLTHMVDGKPCVIGYNIISYRDSSILALVTFDSAKIGIDSFLSGYGSSQSEIDHEQLFNDIAFSESEEPLISPVLWRSLTDHQRLHVRQSLCLPGLRECTTVPRAIKLTRADIIPKPIPEMWQRFVRSLTQR
jgi:hypothetical protein